ncbi:helix-turn-helix transcriptional regulator [Nocardiopsis sp. NPDC007018]|uniref:helix-turn-helix domain-containing protein n=1 Tax=Nocardiopsis sp. NPDC007018 TaxID=3155721 RepID=UPI0034061B01
MSDADSEEVFARLRFGKRLRELRGQKGFSQQELADAAHVSQSAVSDLELGKKGTKRVPVVRLDEALTAQGELVDAWDAVFSRIGMTEYFRQVAGAEQRAVRIRDYSHGGLVHGLLQTEGYVRAINEVARPETPRGSVDQIVVGRQHRQRILEQAHPPAMMMLLDEVVLLRRFHDPQVMKDQIARLIELSRRPRIKIQLVPIATEGHPGLGGSFTIIEELESPAFVYVESQQTGWTLKQPEAVASYDRTFADLGSAALPVSASRDRMEEIRGSIT